MELADRYSWDAPGRFLEKAISKFFEELPAGAPFETIGEIVEGTSEWFHQRD